MKTFNPSHYEQLQRRCFTKHKAYEMNLSLSTFLPNSIINILSLYSSQNGDACDKFVTFLCYIVWCYGPFLDLYILQEAILFWYARAGRQICTSYLREPKRNSLTYTVSAC